MEKSPFEYGATCRDNITGFTGIIVGKASYITGCDQYLLQPECEEGKTGTKQTGEWFDDGRLEVLACGHAVRESINDNTGPGADIEAPKK